LLGEILNPMTGVIEAARVVFTGERAAKVTARLSI
jgi:hypothetical protein